MPKRSRACIVAALCDLAVPRVYHTVIPHGELCEGADARESKSTSSPPAISIAIQVTDAPVVDRLLGVIHQDWQHSRELYLSDSAVLSDLKRHPERGGLAMGASII